MLSPSVEIQITAAVLAAACAILGSFLVLRRMTMLTDAITHAVLPGIVVAYFISHELNSPLLLVGAALAGVVTVWLVETIFQTGNLRQDAAIGVVFPALFALGVFLISRYASDVHLDIDAVLLGELAFAPFDRYTLGPEFSLPRSLVHGLVALMLNAVLVLVFYKELLVSSFDQPVAETQGFKPRLIHYGLMLLVSLTAVFAFDAVGSILVVSFFAVPAATAFLLVTGLRRMIVAAVGIGVVAALSGYQTARLFDVSIAGAMSVLCGVLFLTALVFAPHNGVVAGIMRRHRFQRQRTANLLLVHLLHHQQEPHSLNERRLDGLHRHLSWHPEAIDTTVDALQQSGLVRIQDGVLFLTDLGHSRAEQVLLGRGPVSQ